MAYGSRKRARAVRAGYRSGFEKDFHENNPSLQFEPIQVPYCTEHTRVVDNFNNLISERKLTRKYTPDFVSPCGGIWYETKGRFTAADRKKMLAVKASHPHIRIVMVFQRHNNKLTKAVKSKTYAEWCEANGIEWLQYTKELRV